MFIEKLSRWIAIKLSKYISPPEEVSQLVSNIKGESISLNEDDCIDVFAYSLEVYLGEIFKFLIMGTLAIIFGVLDIYVGVSIGFCFLRTRAGGFHAENFFRCLFITIGLMASSIFCSLFITDKIYLLIIILILSIILISLFAPVGSKEKPIKTEDIRIQRRKESITMFIKLFVLSIILIIIGFLIPLPFILKIGLGISSGILTESLTLTPLGIKTLTLLENIFQAKK